MIRIAFRCDGASGRERIGECDRTEILLPDGYGSSVLPIGVESLKQLGWSFRPSARSGKLVVRCPSCEVLRKSRIAAKIKRDRMREARGTT